MYLLKLILPLALLTGCTSAPLAKAADCSAFEHCVVQNGIAVLAAPEIAEPILLTAQQGAVGFKRYFEMNAAPIAIVPGGEITPGLQDDLTEAGYSLSLPWISAADKKTLAESSVRSQVMEQTKGMPPEQRDAIINMALAKLDKSESTSGDMSATEQGALTHELGHMWFISAFKPEGGDKELGKGYGSWAPDWLDETAAVLLENDTLTDSRRKAFKEMKREDFYPLETFLTMEHPALKSALALKDKFGNKESPGGSQAIILTGEEAEEFLKSSGKSDPANFYTQARGFADYVIEATGDEQIFAKLASHLSGGGEMKNWLVQADGLADNMQDLTEDWHAVLAAR